MNSLLVPTQIIYAKRRSIALIINNKGEFVVRAPKNVKECEITAFIAKKQQWIITKRTQILNLMENSKLNLEDGAYFNLFGSKTLIKVENCKTAKVKNGVLVLPQQNREEALKSLLKRELKKYLVFRVAEIAKQCNFIYKSISISSARTNWGSCGAKNSLNFTYKLALCPYPVVDYIIVHELCHTRIKNHSTKFWAEVKKVYPEYKHCEKWLKDNRTIINMI